MLVDPQRLNDADVTLNQIIRTTGNALEVSPLSFLEASSPGTGGFIDTMNQRLHIFHEQAISSAEELALVPIEDPQGNVAPSDGSALTLGDVTEVVEDHQPLIGDALCSGGECLLLVIEKFPDANTPEVAQGIDAALGSLAPGLPGLQMDTSIYRPAEFISTSFDNLGRAALIGAILLILVLGALYFDWRSALVSTAAIAMSLAAAWLVLYFTQTTVNTMILAGLVMALVTLVDDAVIDVDNVAQHLRRQHEQGAGTPAWQGVIDATLEMRSGVLFATLIVAAVLLPAFFLEGEAGAFLPAIATAYLLAIVASIVVAITVTPALGMMLLGRSRERRGSPVSEWFRRGYEGVAPRLVSKIGPAAAVFGLFLVAGLVAIPFLDPSMRPVLKERDVVVRLDAPPGTSLPRMDEITAQAVEQLRSMPEITDVGAHVGRAIQSDQVVNVNSAEVWVSIDPSADYGETIASIESVANDLPDVSSDVSTYSEQRITEVLGRGDRELVVRIYGQDQQILETKAEEVRSAIAGIDGLDDVQLDIPPREPTIEVQPDIAAAERVGLAPGDVRRAATTLLSGLVVGNLFEEQKVFDVAVWGVPEIREDPSDVGNLLIDTPDGGLVRLGEIADVRVAPNLAVINHESAESYLDVVANVSGRDVGDAAADVELALGSVEFPLEHHAELLGGYAEDAAARSRVTAVAVAALIVVFLLLQAAFVSWRLATLAFLALPMALAGAVLAVLVTGGDVTLGTVAGFVAVFGIAARWVVILIRHYERLRRDGEPFGSDLVIRGTRDRLVPILTTAIGSAAVFVPFAVSSAAAGFEIVGPMAAVILGGLVTSTLLTLVVIPAAYLRFGFMAAADTAAEELFVRIPDVDTVGEGR